MDVKIMEHLRLGKLVIHQLGKNNYRSDIEPHRIIVEPGDIVKENNELYLIVNIGDRTVDRVKISNKIEIVSI